MMPVLKLGKSVPLELKVILGVLGMIIILPFIAVVSVANAGVSAVSNALAFINPVTHLVDLLEPDGKVVKHLTLATTWPAQGIVTLEFGASDPPYQPHHTGIDIAGKLGDPITPFMPGKVIKVNTKDDNICGEYVELDHGDHIISLYCHMSQPKATVGQEVKPGDTIGLEGQTGAASGVHVHFQINVYGIPVDPRTFVTGNPTSPRSNK